MTRQVLDAQLQVTVALSNGAGTATSGGIDLGITSNADFQADVELLIDGPVLTTGELPDGETMTYAVYHDSASDFSGEALLADSVLVQTGAGGAGASAAEGRLALPTNVSRYLRIKAVNSGAGDASGKSLTASLAH